MNRVFFWILTLSLLGTASPAIGMTAFEKDVRSALLDVLEKRAVYPNETVLAVRTLRPSDPALFRRAKVLTSLVLPPGESGKGTVTAQLRVSTGKAGTSESMLWVMARIDAKVPTLVTSRAITRGTLLSEEDMEFKLLPMGRSTLAKAQVIGSVATRELKSGERLTKSVVRAPNIVHRGDVVQAVLQRESFSLQTKVEIMGRGAVGDTVHAKLLQTGKVVRARIDSPEVIRLLL